MPIANKDLASLAKELTQQQLTDLQIVWKTVNKEKIAAELKVKKAELKAKIKEAKAALRTLESEWVELTGKAVKATGKRTAGLKESVIAFLTSKGKEGAHIDDIVEHTGKPKPSINAFLASTGKKAGIKGKGNRSGIYFLK